MSSLEEREEHTLHFYEISAHYDDWKGTGEMAYTRAGR
jgi:hypothetical protein